MGEEHPTRGVERPEQRLGGVVAVDVAEAHQVERVGGHHLEARVVVQSRGQALGERDVLADVVAQPLGAVGAQHEPQLERPEPPAERHLPVAVVDHRARLGGRVAQVLGQRRSGRRSSAARSATQKQSQSKLVNSHLCGFMQKLSARSSAVDDPAQLRAHAAPTRHGRRRRAATPRAPRTASAIGGQRVDGRRRGGADVGDDEARREAGGAVLGHRGRQRVGPHREVRRRPRPSGAGRAAARRCAPPSRSSCAPGWTCTRAGDRTVRRPAARQRAASSAHSVAPDADSSITPPPSPSERKRSGSPSSSAIQSRTCVSSSVHAGDVDHSIPCTPSPDDTRSASTDGPDAPVGK